ncbi:tetratricopeptide repeat protein [Clostridium bornimense]|uniref:tetratricopeptide repeat protein n=1 Tax=Clostridium bornimense TaxID=1216932 RepID=UPI00209E2FFF|nr:hypothetical protein [Clostridium bornimense]
MNNFEKDLQLAINDFDVYKAEEIIENKLKDDNENIDLWIKLGVTVLCPPLVDYEKALKCVEKIYELDNDNLYALILECYTHHFELGGVDSKMYHKLNNIKTDNKKLLSMIKYIMSWYYRFEDYENREKLLIESINLCDRFVCNFNELGYIFFRQNKLSESQAMYKKALDNIQLVYPKENYIDFTDIKELIFEEILGIHITDSNKEYIEKSLLKVNKLLNQL